MESPEGRYLLAEACRLADAFERIGSAAVRAGGAWASLVISAEHVARAVTDLAAASSPAGGEEDNVEHVTVAMRPGPR